MGLRDRRLDRTADFRRQLYLRDTWPSSGPGRSLGIGHNMLASAFNFCNMPTPAHSVRHRPADRHGDGGCHWQRSGVSKGPECTFWLGLIPKPMFQRRQSQASGHQQAWQYFSAGYSFTAEDPSRPASRATNMLRALLCQLESRANTNVASVAMANKLARIAWVVLSRQEDYRSGCDNMRWQPVVSR